MRIRNGEDWLEAAVLSHIDFLDEIVAVHNGCTDSTPAILARLQAAYPDKIRVVHYLPRVYPVGSDLHMRTPENSVNSIANYYNYALSLTRCSIATKLDDDHIAMRPMWKALRNELESTGFRLGRQIWCFSGINLVDCQGCLKVHAEVPFAGNGDHWLFEVSPCRFFTRDKRFERFNRRGLDMRFKGINYWHLKYLKKDHGFSNYELESNPKSRYHKQKARFMAGQAGVSLMELSERCRQQTASRGFASRLSARLSAKKRLVQQREEHFDFEFLQAELNRLDREIIHSGTEDDPL